MAMGMGGSGGVGPAGAAGQSRGAREALAAGPGRDPRQGVDRVGNRWDSRLRNMRYQQNTIATRPATVGNIATGAMLGLGMGPTSIVNMGRMIGGWDPYSGPVGKTTGFSYDGPNRAGTMSPQRRNAMVQALRGGSGHI